MSVAASRRILVTGASSGIGRTIVEHLAAGGHAVIAGARKESDLAALGRLPNVTAMRLDVTRPEDVAEAAAAIGASGSGLYGLVNNAGIAGMGPLVETSVEELHRVLEVNVDGVHRMVCAMFPFLREARGRIVNISSVGGILTEPFLGTYGVSKHAVEAYTDILRDELTGFGVRVSAVEPGPFRSEIIANGLARKGDELRRQFERSIYRDMMLGALEAFSATPDALHRRNLPVPTPVAEAVAHALFAPEPKRRYLVADKDVAEAVVDRVLMLLTELNERQPQSLPMSELVAKLQKTTR
jgi:NAD(P)-dependent dehydrogenase (short-subunit alcohol dehydrogenase family)